MFKNNNGAFYVILISLLFWSSLAFLMIFHPIDVVKINHFKDAAQLVVNIFLICLSFKLYKNNIGKDKRIFLWLFFSAIAIFIEDLSYYLLVFVSQIPTKNLEFTSFLVINIPYLFWVVTSAVFLSKILIGNIFKYQTVLKMLCGFVICNVIIIALFFLSKTQYLSDLSGVVIGLDFSCFAELILFDLTILCLIYVEDVGFKFFLSGISIVISSAFLFNYSFVDYNGNLAEYADLIWFLGIFFMFFGLIKMRKKTYNIGDCFRKTNAIKSILIFWTFGFSIISFLLFFIVAYWFSIIDTKDFAGLPFFITTYSVAVVVFSILMGNHFEEPFKKIAANIEVFMLNKDKNQIQNQFSIEEFIFLQKFILNVFEVNEEKNIFKKKISLVAAQVAHDIRSPLSVLQTIANNVEDRISKQEYDMISSALNRISEVANNLVIKYKKG